MDKLVLNNELLLGIGRERATFIHPTDDTKVVKIVSKKEEKLNQSILEYKYMKYLISNNVPFTHLTTCYGKIETDQGEGYVFDRVRDYTGNTSKSFKGMVLEGILSKEEELKLIEELREYIFKYNILFIDIALSNVFCQEIQEGKFKLVLTDGIGGKRLGVKSTLYKYSKAFTRYKVKKQWKKFLDKYDTVIKKGIEEKTRKFY